ncbi:MAG: RNA-binding S4 domain-containing protein [Paracoccaceae bacterium]
MRIRLDKWLWHARFAKTRTQSATLAETGHLRLNSRPVTKAAQLVGPGDVLTLVSQGRVRVVHILATGVRRGDATEAQKLYREEGPPSSGVTPAKD